MIRFVLRRLPSALLVLVVASVVVFFVLRLAPGDPAVTLAGPDADQTVVNSIREQLGLNQPLVVQYLIWSRGMVTGDLGNSYILHAPIAELIGNSLLNTVELAVGALILALAFGGLVGFVLGSSRRRWVQVVLGTLNSGAFAVPTYVTGVLLILVFAVTYRILPSGGVGPGLSDFEIGVQYLLMPAVALSLPTAATIARFLSASMRQTLDEDFVQTAVAKGLSTGACCFGTCCPTRCRPY